MSKRPSEGKAPVTGRSAQERVKARKTTAAGGKVVDKRIEEASEHRGRIVLGDAAVRYAGRYRGIGRLIATALHETDQEDVRDWLAGLSSGEGQLPAAHAG